MAATTKVACNKLIENSCEKKFAVEKTMTLKEVALLLKYDESTIRKIGKDLFPDLFKNGIKTELNENQITLIKLNLGKNSELPKTNLEKKILVAQAIQILNEEIEELKEKVEHMQPKVESFEALQRCEKNMSITEAAKHFGLHPKLEVFPYLRNHGYLTSKDLPTQKAIDENILSVRQTKINETEFKSQAVVNVSSLETWRTKIVDNIKYSYIDFLTGGK